MVVLGAAGIVESKCIWVSITTRMIAYVVVLVEYLCCVFFFFFNNVLLWILIGRQTREYCAKFFSDD